MPTIRHEFDRRLRIANWLRGDDRGWSRQRRAWRSEPLRILMIKAQAAIMIPNRVEG
jgi:hypothetical protein